MNKYEISYNVYFNNKWTQFKEQILAENQDEAIRNFREASTSAQYKYIMDVREINKNDVREKMEFIKRVFS